MPLTRNFKILRRYRQIIGIAIKYGLQDILADADLGITGRVLTTLIPHGEEETLKKYNKWERIRMAVEELGTTYIKFAQILSNRPDVIPLELVQEFEKLQSHVPPFPGEIAVEIIEKELGRSINSVFKEFDEVPFASASIAQVHKARLLTGEKVVVKVRRPDITKIIDLDMAILEDIARRLDERGLFSNLDPEGIIRTFDVAIHKEINLTHEGYNLQRFATNFSAEEMIYVPKYYPNLTTPKMMVMEFIDGIHPYHFDELEKAGLNRHELAANGLHSMFVQIFEHGFFHADPHPGNLFAMPGNRVCFIDFGMMGTVLKTDVEFFADIVYGVTSKDTRRLIWGLKNIAVAQKFEESRTFEYEVTDLVNDYHALPTDNVNMTELFDRLLKLVNKYHIKMPGDYFLLSKALVTIEGVGRRLDPTLSIIDELTPHINKTIAEELSPRALFKRVLNATRDSFTLFENLPRDMRDIITKIKRGEVKVAIEHEGLDEMTHKIDVASNRVAGGFIIGSILMSSSILIAVRLPPLYSQHYSILGIIGFVIAIVLGLRMLFTIFRNRKY
jgi:ubiquinone biosynthesis protein